MDSFDHDQVVFMRCLRDASEEQLREFVSRFKSYLTSIFQGKVMRRSDSTFALKQDCFILFCAHVISLHTA